MSREKQNNNEPIELGIQVLLTMVRHLDLPTLGLVLSRTLRRLLPVGRGLNAVTASNVDFCTATLPHLAWLAGRNGDVEFLLKCPPSDLDHSYYGRAAIAAAAFGQLALLRWIDARVYLGAAMDDCVVASVQRRQDGMFDELRALKQREFDVYWINPTLASCFASWPQLDWLERSQSGAPTYWCSSLYNASLAADRLDLIEWLWANGHLVLEQPRLNDALAHGAVRIAARLLEQGQPPQEPCMASALRSSNCRATVALLRRHGVEWRGVELALGSLQHCWQRHSAVRECLAFLAELGCPLDPQAVLALAPDAPCRGCLCAWLVRRDCGAATPEMLRAYCLSCYADQLLGELRGDELELAALCPAAAKLPIDACIEHSAVHLALEPGAACPFADCRAHWARCNCVPSWPTMQREWLAGRKLWQALADKHFCWSGTAADLNSTMALYREQKFQAWTERVGRLRRWGWSVDIQGVALPQRYVM
jgi:hypothetical protein